MEFKFWDKYAVHVRSHWILKTITVILTIAVILLGYYMWQSARPSAKKEIDIAREYARQCQFAQARSHLENATTARLADRYRAERRELASQIDQWEETVKNWAEVKELLKNRKWISANKILGPMLWRYNYEEDDDSGNDDGDDYRCQRNELHTG